jgi:uncharacterized protein YecE (DUF72 family)
VGELRIGISGWRYVPWRGVFYPEGLAQREELAFAARQVNSIEINGSFYSLQRPESYARWREATPEGFVFAVKGSRFITHMKRLLEIETPLANFLASGVLGLREKLGPILWQFPESFAFDRDRFEAFFRLLPRDTRAAAKLARRHDERLDGRCAIPRGSTLPLRHAVEVRSETFATPEFVALLREHRIALVVADTAGRWPYLEDVTADFVYVRLHGDEELYASGYTDRALDRWAERIRAWSTGREPRDAQRITSRLPPKRASRDVYVYFDNDIKVHAPFDAMALARRLGVSCAPAGPALVRDVRRPLKPERRTNPWRPRR